MHFLNTTNVLTNRVYCSGNTFILKSSARLAYGSFVVIVLLHTMENVKMSMKSVKGRIRKSANPLTWEDDIRMEENMSAFSEKSDLYVFLEFVLIIFFYLQIKF